MRHFELILCSVQLIAQSLSAAYVEKMVEFLAIKLETSCHLQFYLTWCSHLLSAHGGYLKEHSASIMSKLRDLQKSIVEKHSDLGAFNVTVYIQLVNQFCLLIVILAVISNLIIIM